MSTTTSPISHEAMSLEPHEWGTQLPDGTQTAQEESLPVTGEEKLSFVSSYPTTERTIRTSRGYLYTVIDQPWLTPSRFEPDETTLETRPTVAVYDEYYQNEFSFDPNGYEAFKKLDVGMREYSAYCESKRMTDAMSGLLPSGELAVSIKTALEAKITDQLAHLRRRRLEGLGGEPLELIYVAQRDLTFALAAIAKCLSLGKFHYGDEGYIEDEYVRAWYVKGGSSHSKERGDSSFAQYEVCNESGFDEGDQEDVLSGLDDEDYPEGFHYPGKLEVKVDPGRRIEFIYTPEKESARVRHQSHSLVHHVDGRVIEYKNESLSIRIDLDETAPHGIALDVGRTAYEGVRDGRQLKRSGDLLGGVLAEASSTGSHEYTGFTDTSKEEFRNFAERLAIWLGLQKIALRK